MREVPGGGHEAKWLRNSAGSSAGARGEGIQEAGRQVQVRRVKREVVLPAGPSLGNESGTLLV